MANSKKKEKDDNKILIIILLAVIAYLLWSNKEVINNNYFNGSLGSGGSGAGGQPQNNQGGYSLTLSLNPTDFCAGSQVIGTITSNMPNAACNSGFNAGMGWMPLQTFNLAGNGGYISSQVINAIGGAQIRAICCINGDCKISNEVTIISRTCTTTTTTGQNTPTTYLCTDSDNGINYPVLGNCQDSYHGLGYYDFCDTGLNRMTEYYCDDAGICQYVYGTCTTQNACTSVWNPSPVTCSAAVCPTGTCIFHEATLSTVASCGCG
jgi:hypothetical protein